MKNITFKDLKLNKPFTIYKRLSSVRYEKRRAIVFEQEPHYIGIALLTNNSHKNQMAYGNYASTWFYVKYNELEKDNFGDSLFCLNKPNGKTIVKKVSKTIILE